MPDGKRYCDACGAQLPIDYEVKPRSLHFDNGSGDGTTVQIGLTIEVESPFDSVDGADICEGCILRTVGAGV